jgi:hypothetical protein
MVYAAGLLAGLAFYAEIYGLIEPFTGMTEMGEMTLPKWLGLPAGAVVLAVLVLAVATFAVAGVLEKRFAGRRPAQA